MRTTTPDQTADDLAALQAECEDDGGTDCDPAAYIGVDVAICLAVEFGLDEGLEGYTASLLYNHGAKTACWNVQNVTDRSDSGASGGDWMLLHATTGELLEEGGWDIQP